MIYKLAEVFKTIKALGFGWLCSIIETDRFKWKLKIVIADGLVSNPPEVIYEDAMFPVPYYALFWATEYQGNSSRNSFNK